MRKKFILTILTGSLALGLFFSLKKKDLNPETIKALGSSPQPLKGILNFPETSPSIYKEISSKDSTQDNEVKELNNQLSVLERYMEENRVIDQLKRKDIAPSEQSRYFEVIIEKQKILEKIVNIEIEKSKKLIAEGKSY